MSSVCIIQNLVWFCALSSKWNRFSKTRHKTIKIQPFSQFHPIFSSLSEKLSQLNQVRMAKASPLMKATEKTKKTNFHWSVSKGYHTGSSRHHCIASIQILRLTWKSKAVTCATVPPCTIPVLHCASLGTRRSPTVVLHSLVCKETSFSLFGVGSKTHRCLLTAIQSLTNTKRLGKLCPDYWLESGKEEMQNYVTLYGMLKISKGQH